MKARGLVALILVLIAVLLNDQAALAKPNPPGGGSVAGSIAGSDGIFTNLSEREVSSFPATPSGQPIEVADPATVIRYEYTSTPACGGAHPESLDSHLCEAALAACTNPANGPGPRTWIWRRSVQNGQQVVGWSIIGATCYGNVAPNARPMLTMAMIQDAFNTTPWATARTEVEPVGNVTLVGLETFYRVEWSAEGFQPGEVNAIDPARMLGYRVDVRPRLVGLTYRFGDGSEFGPTPSLGGRYPSGSIRHQYEKTGTYPVSVGVTWGGDFRIDGGEWTPIPNTVTVQGPATALDVKAARAVLVQR